MLRFTIAPTCFLLLVGISCSKVKKEGECPEGTDPRTGQCVSVASPDTSRIASLQAQIEAQTKQIQQMIESDKAKAAEILTLRNILNDKNSTQSQKDRAVKELSELGVNVAVRAGVSVAEALLKSLDEALGLTPASEPNATPNTGTQ